jgi:hypothetical protein
MSLELVFGQLEGLPNVVDTDLKGVGTFIDAVSEVFTDVHEDVLVNRAVLELHNAAGYPVGHIVFEFETELYRFIPHSDQTEES